MVIGILVVLSVVIAYVVTSRMQEGIEAFATEKAKNDLNMATRLVDYKYSGAWQIKDGQLYKGSIRGAEASRSIGNSLPSSGAAHPKH
ncbi:hypothetical protein ACTP13_05080 [Paenibacillus peoriae]|uniref:hypothetical protein n=1 Tax=Paenibacillus peoriae TaxID=59893 RepID=UPI003F9D060F